MYREEQIEQQKLKLKQEIRKFENEKKKEKEIINKKVRLGLQIAFREQVLRNKVILIAPIILSLLLILPWIMTNHFIFNDMVELIKQPYLSLTNSVYLAWNAGHFYSPLWAILVGAFWLIIVLMFSLILSGLIIGTIGFLLEDGTTFIDWLALFGLLIVANFLQIIFQACSSVIILGYIIAWIIWATIREKKSKIK